MESNEQVPPVDQRDSKTLHEKDLGHQPSSSAEVQVDKTNSASTFVPNCGHDVCQRTIFVRNVPFSMAKNQLREFFDKFGKTDKVHVYNSDSDTEKHSGQAEVEYFDVSTALNVVTSPKEEQFHNGRFMKMSLSRCKYSKHDSKQTPSNDGEKRKSVSPCHFNKLPDEMINYIFSYFNFGQRIGIERVCKRWQHVNTNITWKNMLVLNFQEKFNQYEPDPTKPLPLLVLKEDILVSILKRCGKTLRKIDFEYCNTKLTFEYPIEIAKYCPNLESVNLCGTSIDLEAIKSLFEGCKNIQTLKLQSCGFAEKDLCWLLSTEGKNIKYLDISDNIDITGECFYLVNNCLETLILDYCSRLSSRGFRQLQNSRIKYLSIMACNSLIVDPDIVAVVTSLDLTALHLSIEFEYDLMDRFYLAKVFEQCGNVQYLSVGHCTADFFRSIFKNCRRLRYLNTYPADFIGLDPSTLRELPHLQSLELSDSCNVNRDVILKLSSAGKLEHVVLRRSGDFGDEECIALIKNSPNLKVLNVACCEKVTNLTVHEARKVKCSDKHKLEIIARGTNITEFVNNDTLCVSLENKFGNLNKTGTFDRKFLNKLFL